MLAMAIFFAEVLNRHRQRRSGLRGSDPAGQPDGQPEGVQAEPASPEKPEREKLARQSQGDDPPAETGVGTAAANGNK